MINFVLATVYGWRVATHNSLLVHWKPRLLMYETWHAFQGWHQKASRNSENHSTHQAYSPTPSGCFWKSSSSTDALQLPKQNPLEGKQTGAFHVFQWKQQWEITRNLLRVSEGISSERKQKASAQPLFFFQNSFPWESNTVPVSMKRDLDYIKIFQSGRWVQGPPEPGCHKASACRATGGRLVQNRLRSWLGREPGMAVVRSWSQRDKTAYYSEVWRYVWKQNKSEGWQWFAGPENPDMCHKACFGEESVGEAGCSSGK